MIRILLTEDLAVIRESLEMAFANVTDMQLRCCSSVEDGIDLLNESSGLYDVVLVKQSAWGRKADELLSITNRNDLKNRVLIITRWLSEFERRRMASLGVAGIFAKQRSLADLISAVRTVAGGQTWFDKLSANEDTVDRTLSCQERRAAEFVLDGLTNKEIGVRMRISESSIKALLQRVFLKLGAHTRGQLVRILMERSLAS
jgi:two-component system nitrate/nitrite response regulator NarL